MEMTAISPRILILEDDTVFHEWLEQALGDEYDLSFAKTTTEADKLIALNFIFDIVLVDEHLENERGSAWIKQNAEAEGYSTSFVLYSGTETEESLVKSLACGASDYLVKPMPPAVLKMRIEKLLQYQAHTQKDKSHTISQYNLTDQTHQYFLYMQFDQKLNSCKTAAKVEQITLEFLNELSLYGCLAIHEPGRETIYKNSVQGACSPIEMQVMELLKGKAAIHSIENRQYFYHPAVSLMIYNLPTDKDNKALIIDTIAAAVESIGSTLKLLNYQNTLLEVQELARQSASDVCEFINNSKTLKADVATAITSEISTSFHTLDLTDEKEEFLRYMIDKVLTRYVLDDDKYHTLINTFEKTAACAKNAVKN